MNDKTKSRLTAILITFFPLLSLIIAIGLMANGDGEKSTAAANSETASPPLLIILLGLSLLATKIFAVISSIRLHYFGWVYHVLELHIVIFLLGLIVVLSTFNQSWDITGAIKLILAFLLTAVNLELKALWMGKRIQSSFRVFTKIEGFSYTSGQ